MQNKYDVLVIGAGIIGACVLQELSKFQLKIAVIDKENDAAEGTTKANSAIVHAGYDPVPGTKMALHNVRGNRMVKDLCERYHVAYKECGSLVIATDEDEVKSVEKLYARGVENGVPGIRILSAEETKAIEPNLRENILCSLYAPTAGVVNPWELCIALTETAVKNGADHYFGQAVTDIKREADGYAVTLADGTVLYTSYLVSAAGIYADRIHEMLAPADFTITPGKGEYFLLDKNQGHLVEHVIFQCPSKAGKGILVSPTVHGNLIVGPDRTDGTEREDYSVEADHLREIREISKKTCDKVDFRQSIRNFAGLRAISGIEDFIIREIDGCPGAIELAGIQSPGLSSSPSIALEAVELLEKAGLKLNKKEHFIDSREIVRMKELSPEERQKKIAENPLYGRIICRCESITEGEIVDALKSPIAPPTVDAVKRRTGAGMGRCQGGFCLPRVLEIIARERGIDPAAVQKDKDGSFILLARSGEEDAE